MRTQWTKEGIAFSKTKEYRNGKIAAKAGIHYVVLRSEKDEYYTFPEEPFDVYKVFRHSWVLVRKRIPDVVVIEGLKLPSTARSAAFNAQYCSLFFRPWTLSVLQYGHKSTVDQNHSCVSPVLCIVDYL